MASIHAHHEEHRMVQGKDFVRITVGSSCTLYYLVQFCLQSESTDKLAVNRSLKKRYMLVGDSVGAYLSAMFCCEG